MGGLCVLLRFAGPALIPFLTPALEHLEVESSQEPDLTVCLWDSESTNTKMPPPPWSSEDYLPRGEVRGFNNERIRTVLDLGSGILSLLDTANSVALYWIPQPTAVPYWETGAPLRTIFHWFMGRRQRRFVHAAAVGKPDGGVLLAGKGGSGKSTTTLACLSSNLLYAGDDYVLLHTEPSPFVYSLYNSAKLDVEAMNRLPHLADKVSNADRLDEEKAVIFLNHHFRQKLAPGFPVRAILIPRITGGLETKLKETSAATGLKALAPSTIFQLPGAERESFQSLIGFVRQVPSYELELGTDLTRIHEVILELLSSSVG
jgi:hypothetical protein